MKNVNGLFLRTGFLLGGMLASSSLFAANTTIDPVGKFAYGANTGWINLRPDSTNGVVVGELFLSGYAYAANCGWIHFGDGSPTNGYAYGNADALDYGVNQDGSGNLSGLAYAANIGWINFGWATPTDPQRPHLNLLDGKFAGYAWSANTGWMNLGSGWLQTASIDRTDTDNDQIADAWEYRHFGDLSTAGPNTHGDADGVNDADEYAADTDPHDPSQFFKIATHTYNASYTKAALTLETTRPSRQYRLESTDDLEGMWQDSPYGIFAPDSGTSTFRTLTFPYGPHRYSRAVLVLPLQP